MIQNEKLEWVEVTDQNTKDIQKIKTDINTIKDNHLYHIEKIWQSKAKQLKS